MRGGGVANVDVWREREGEREERQERESQLVEPAYP